MAQPITVITTRDDERGTLTHKIETRSAWSLLIHDLMNECERCESEVAS